MREKIDSTNNQATLNNSIATRDKPDQSVKRDLSLATVNKFQILQRSDWTRIIHW